MIYALYALVISLFCCLLFSILNSPNLLIKCNINKEGKKIYHLPEDSLYDVTEIDTSKGECYVSSIEEAENKGFVRTKIK